MDKELFEWFCSLKIDATETEWNFISDKFDRHVKCDKDLDCDLLHNLALLMCNKKGAHLMEEPRAYNITSEQWVHMVNVAAQHAKELQDYTK